MALFAAVDVAVSFFSLTNHTSTEPGLYHIRCSAELLHDHHVSSGGGSSGGSSGSGESGGGGAGSTSDSLISLDDNHEIRMRREEAIAEQLYFRAFASQTLRMFITRTVLISRPQEHRALNDMVTFHIQVPFIASDAKGDLESAKCLLHFDLHHGTPGEDIAETVSSMKFLSRRTYSLRRFAFPGINEGLLVHFDRRHFMSSAVTIHSSCTSFFYRPASELLHHKSSLIHRLLHPRQSASSSAASQSAASSTLSLGSVFGFQQQALLHQSALEIFTQLCFILFAFHRSLRMLHLKFIAVLSPQERDAFTLTSTPSLTLPGVAAPEASPEAPSPAMGQPSLTTVAGAIAGINDVILKRLQDSFVARINSLNNPDEVALALIETIHPVSTQLQELWARFLFSFGLTESVCKNLFVVCEHRYRMLLRSRIFVQTFNRSDCEKFVNLTSKDYLGISELIQQSDYIKLSSGLSVELANAVGSVKTYPIIFQDQFLRGTHPVKDAPPLVTQLELQLSQMNDQLVEEEEEEEEEVEKAEQPVTAVHQRQPDEGGSSPPKETSARNQRFTRQISIRVTPADVSDTIPFLAAIQEASVPNPSPKRFASDFVPPTVQVPPTRDLETSSPPSSAASRSTPNSGSSSPKHPAAQPPSPPSAASSGLSRGRMRALTSLFKGKSMDDGPAQDQDQQQQQQQQQQSSSSSRVKGILTKRRSSLGEVVLGERAAKPSMPPLSLSASSSPPLSISGSSNSLPFTQETHGSDLLTVASTSGTAKKKLLGRVRSGSGSSGTPSRSRSGSQTSLVAMFEEHAREQDVLTQRERLDQQKAEFCAALKMQIPLKGFFYSELQRSESILHPFMKKSHSGVNHLVVFVHGLEGTDSDLINFRNFMLLMMPTFDCYLATSNISNTYVGFNKMADNLAEELVQYLSAIERAPDHISFVGHSLGNVIIRTCLTRPSMQPYLRKLHTFVSINGPHLGTIFGESTAVQTGLWALRKIHKSEQGSSLTELALADASDPRETFLYKLSARPCLALFNNVLLISSTQDHYVPFHSARIEMNPKALKDRKLGPVYLEMLAFLLEPIKKFQEIEFVRYNIVNEFAERDVDVRIGRAAHISILVSELVLKQLIAVVVPYLQSDVPVTKLYSEAASLRERGRTF